jgi:hypothetical protein
MLASCVSIATEGESGHGSADENQSHTFQVGDNPTIDVTGFNGAVEIIVGPDGEVKVESKLKIPSRVSYSASLSGNTVTIVAKKNWFGIHYWPVAISRDSSGCARTGYDHCAYQQRCNRC